jgi:predicted transcriptional regulator
MSIVISLSPEVEARLREKAAQQGQDISLVAAELLARILEWEFLDSQEAVAGIQRGLTTQGNCHKASEVQNFLSPWGLD